LVAHSEALHHVCIRLTAHSLALLQRKEGPLECGDGERREREREEREVREDRGTAGIGKEGEGGGTWRTM
jgi:hypothetical protein